jgi:osmoprotectant transport system permease protein
VSLPALVAQASGSIRWSWINDHWDDIGERTVEHLQLTGWTMLFGLVLSLLLAVVAIQRRSLYSPIASVTAVLFTIPSIALVPLLVPFTGIGTATAVIPLVLYTLLILVRNIVAGLDGVPREVLEAADGMGYGRTRRFLEIELPLAAPVILAGVRIATVTTIGLVTITGLIGLGGLGFFIFDGLQSNLFIPKLTVGAVGPLLMALVAEALLHGLERLVTPWTRRGVA